MKHIKAPLDILKDIILLYANTKPDPIESLLEIDEVLKKGPFNDQERNLSNEAWNYYKNGEVLHLIMELNKIGPSMAKEILDDEKKMEEYLSEYFHTTPADPGMKYYKRDYETAFGDIYGYLWAHSCPCNLTKWDVLEKEGFVDSYENSKEGHFPRWIKARPNCLQCDHIHFVAILRDLETDNYDLLTDIVKGYRKVSTEEMSFGNRKIPLFKIIFQYQYEENKGAFPGYLDGLPCNVLVDLLSSGNYAKKIKECPICSKFFFAEDTKRKICYESSCFTEYKRRQKQRQRGNDPVKYA